MQQKSKLNAEDVFAVALDLQLFCPIISQSILAKSSIVVIVSQEGVCVQCKWNNTADTSSRLCGPL